jgi:hypothetical protein
VIWFDGRMRRVLPTLFAVLLGTLTLLGTAGASSAAPACTPLAPGTAAQQADAVFTGVLAGAGRADDTVKPKRFTYPVTVQQSLKGTARGNVNVVTRGGPCGVGELKAGATYLFFVNAHGRSWLAPRELGTTSANVTALVPQVQAALAPPTVTFGDPLLGAPASLKRVAAPGVALVLIGLLGLLFVRRRPRPQA